MRQSIPEYTFDRSRALEERASTGWLIKWKVGNLWIKTPGNLMYWMGEGYAEIIASQVCKDLGIRDYVEYRPCIVNTTDEQGNTVRLLGCESTDFLNSGEIFISSQKLLSLLRPKALSELNYLSGQEAYVKYIDEIGELTNLDIKEHLDNMIMLDFLICNFDRNFWNMGLIVNSNGNYRLAPIFDNGSSLGLDRFEEGKFYREQLTYRQAHPFSSRFEKQLELVTGRKYKIALESAFNTIDTLREQCSKHSNVYEVLNTIPDDSFEYIATMLNKNREYIEKHRSDLIG